MKTSVIKTEVNFTKKEHISLFQIEAGMTSLVGIIALIWNCFLVWDEISKVT